ncbi:MAG: 3D domain-containing protein [Phycisphaeraceae bacterium]|nr:3D domain-containing protein [Phycisphaeraceae bacterium]
MNNQDQAIASPRRGVSITTVNRCGAVVLLCAMSALSAIITKEAISRQEISPLAAVSEVGGAVRSVAYVPELDLPAGDPLAAATSPAPVGEIVALPANAIADASIRFFNGRPVRPARTMRMEVTGYSPDARSCGKWADGKTCSMHSVRTNASKLVAADTRLLPLGSMVSVPGYHDGEIVPVLDRGGAIKGRKLDLLYPTHNQARQWGRQFVDVVIWEYADEQPACDFRAIRDSR